MERELELRKVENPWMTSFMPKYCTPQCPVASLMPRSPACSFFASSRHRLTNQALNTLVPRDMYEHVWLYPITFSLWGPSSPPSPSPLLLRVEQKTITEKARIITACPRSHWLSRHLPSAARHPARYRSKSFSSLSRFVPLTSGQAALLSPSPLCFYGLLIQNKRARAVFPQESKAFKLGCMQGICINCFPVFPGMERSI